MQVGVTLLKRVGDVLDFLRRIYEVIVPFSIFSGHIEIPWYYNIFKLFCTISKARKQTFYKSIFKLTRSLYIPITRYITCLKFNSKQILSMLLRDYIQHVLRLYLG